MAASVWDRFLGDRDRRVLAACGQGARMGPGKRPALLVIDVNYAFCGERALPVVESIRRWKRSCGEAAWRAVPLIGSLIASAREGGAPVVYSTGRERAGDWRRGASDWKKTWRDERGEAPASEPAGARRGTDIVDEIAPASGDIVIVKHKPSAFHEAPLESHLTLLEVDSLVVCGATTSGCVRATVTDAFSRNYRVAVVADACFDRLEVSHAVSLLDLDMKYADVVDSETARRYLAGARSPQAGDAGGRASE